MPQPDRPEEPATNLADRDSGPRLLGGRALVGVVYNQAWIICMIYAALGIAAELLRRPGTSLGTDLSTFLDGMPLTVIRKLGLLDGYLQAVVSGRLSPFWNRLLLAGCGIFVILFQATLVALVMLVASHLTRRRKTAPGRG